MYQSKSILSVAIVALVFISFSSAQLDFDKCRQMVTGSASKFVQVNRQLLADLQTKATSALGDTVQLNQFNNIIDKMNNELNSMAGHIQAMDAGELMNSFVELSHLQTDVYTLFLDPRFAIKFYDIYLGYILTSTRENTEILAQIPASCVPTRRKQSEQ